MTKNKIKIENQDFDSSKASVHKDFNKINQSFNNSTNGNSWLTKGGTWIAGSAVIVVIVSSIYFLSSENKSQSTQEATNDSIINLDFEIQNYKAPLSEFDIAYEIFELDIVNGNELLSKRGSIINLNNVIFIDNDGNEVRKEVEVWYREFHNPMEIFLAGVPMTTETDSGNMQLVSGGMFELLAKKDGEELQIKEGTSIEVDIVSYNQEDEFNFYTFNEDKNQWDYKDKSKLSDREFVNPTTYSMGSDLDNDLNSNVEIELDNKTNDAVQVQAFQESLLADDYLEEQEYLLELDIDAKSTPDLAAFESVVFKVNTSKSKFDPKYYDTRWTDMKVKNIGGNEYIISLEKADTIINLYAAPVISEAMESKRDLFRKKQVARENRLSENSVSPVNRNFIRRTRFDQSNELVEEVVNNSSEQPVYFTTTVITTGLYNHDYPMAQYKSIAKLEIYDQYGRDIDVTSLYMVDLNLNTVFNMGKTESIRYNPKTKSVLWLVDHNGNIGIANSALMDNKKLNSTENMEFKIYPVNQGLQILQSII